MNGGIPWDWLKSLSSSLNFTKRLFFKEETLCVVDNICMWPNICNGVRKVVEYGHWGLQGIFGLFNWRQFGLLLLKKNDSPQHHWSLQVASALIQIPTPIVSLQACNLEIFFAHYTSDICEALGIRGHACQKDPRITCSVWDSEYMSVFTNGANLNENQKEFDGQHVEKVFYATSRLHSGGEKQCLSQVCGWIIST